MKIEQEAPVTGRELSSKMDFLISQRKDLERLGLDTQPSYQPLFLPPRLTRGEAIDLVDHTMFRIWNDISATGDERLIEATREKVGGLRQFLEKIREAGEI